jgi:hypothetical protein
VLGATLQVCHDLALGSTASGTVVEAGEIDLCPIPTLYFVERSRPPRVGREPLLLRGSLVGTGSWGGDITISGSASILPTFHLFEGEPEAAKCTQGRPYLNLGQVGGTGSLWLGGFCTFRSAHCPSSGSGDLSLDFSTFEGSVDAACGGRLRTYLAEGATGDFFDTRLAVLNPFDGRPSYPSSERFPVTGTLDFRRSDGSVIEHWISVPPESRATLEVKEVPGMAYAEFSTRVRSSRELVVDRTMTWDASGYGAHAETGVAGPALAWYLAEGATHSGFDLFYLIQNPNATPADVEVRYLRPAPLLAITKTYLVAPASRFNIWVNLEDSDLASTDVSAVIGVTNGQPVIVERAMYRSAPGQVFAAGHASVGVTSPAMEWFLAEGATGDFFDLFVLVANPGDTVAQVETVKVTLYFEDGTGAERTFTVAGNSRFNVDARAEFPEALDKRFGASVVSLGETPAQIVVERAMYWDALGQKWAAGTNALATRLR